MEALRTGAAPPVHAETVALERLALPMLIPLGILAFALLVIYGLSRIYLELSNTAATGLAAGIALGILAVAWYLASSSSVPGWQIGFISVAAAALLTGGAIWALVEEDEGEATEEPTAAASPTADETPAPGGPTGALTVGMGDNFFEFEGQQAPTISVASGEEITIDLSNDGLAIHNMHIAGTDNEYGIAICETGGDEPCSDPGLFSPGDTGAITFTFDEAGSFVFRCDFHPVDMIGEIEVQ
jgi:plastocyanin